MSRVLAGDRSRQAQNVHNRGYFFTFLFQAHEGVVRGCSYVPGGSHILTCADDKTIKLWDAAKWNDVPVDTIVSKHMVSKLLPNEKSVFQLK